MPYVYPREATDDWWRHLANVNEERSSVKNALTDPVTLTFQPKAIPFPEYPTVISYTKTEHFGIICRGYTDKNRRTRMSFPRRPDRDETSI